MMIKTACQACHCECGVLVHIQDGRVVKIEGDKDHPMNRGMICAKALAYTQLVYHPDRLIHPLKRVGERGEGKWKKISWDDALDTIAKKFRKIIKKYGSQSIWFAHGTGPKGHNLSFPLLADAIGSPNVSSTTHVCFVPTIIAEQATVGDFITAEAGPDYGHAKCILVWAANPINSHPAMGRDILEAKEKGARLIVVDPRFTVLASKADLWLQIRPGTDDALALGMLNVIINEELYDKEFVDEWCVGFEELRQRAQEYPPERAAEITWIPKEKIEKAARMYATTKPATLHHRVSLDQHTNSVQTSRAVIILVAITGNIDVRGGNIFLVRPDGFESVLSDSETLLPKEVEKMRLGAKKFPLFSGPQFSRGSYSGPLWGQCHVPTTIKAILTGNPYPIKAVFAASNLAVWCENSKEVWEALNKLEFLVVTDFFLTPTAELADIVLPAATWLEKDEICEQSYNNYISVRQKAIEPVGECWDDMKIALELAKKMGLDKKYIPWETVEEINNSRLKGMGITFEDLKEKVYIVEPMRYRKYQERGFRTPSGKVELYSSVFKEFGYDPLPYYEENPESPISTPELMKEYPLILITGARHIAYFHSEGRQIPSLRKLHPDPTIEIHPETAQKLGIKDGDWVWIETPRMKGRIEQRAKLTRGIHPKVVSVQHGWWFPEKTGPDHGCWESNINVIIPNDPPYDPIAGSTPLRGGLCKIYKAKEFR